MIILIINKTIDSTKSKTKNKEQITDVKASLKVYLYSMPVFVSTFALSKLSFFSFEIIKLSISFIFLSSS